MKLNQVSKKYFDSFVLSSIDLEVQEGKLTTLLGENGSGKSTLLRLMVGSELPTSGTIDYRNESVYSYDSSFIGEIVFVHEKLEMDFPYSVRETVKLLIDGHSRWNQSYFDYLTSKRNIDLDKHFSSYSRGQKMQIFLMFYLALAPKTLLIDEITSVIDVYGRKFLLDELRKYVDRGGTVVITTNVINELEFYTDNLIILQDQRIQLNKPVEKILKDFVKLRKPMDKDHPIFQTNLAIWAGVNSDRSVSYIVDKCDLGRFEGLEVFEDRRSSTLEDIYIYYFSRGLKR